MGWIAPIFWLLVLALGAYLLVSMRDGEEVQYDFQNLQQAKAVEGIHGFFPHNVPPSAHNIRITVRLYPSDSFFAEYEFDEQDYDKVVSGYTVLSQATEIDRLLKAMRKNAWREDPSADARYYELKSSGSVAYLMLDTSREKAWYVYFW